jgi:hypothetical protein
MLFETINNRGLRLSATDIIKNFILGNAARFGATLLELARERWGELLSELDGIAIDAFFRQYMMAHLARRVTKTEVVAEFQKSFMHEVEEADALPERSHYAGLADDADDDTDDTDEGAIDEDDQEDDPGEPGDGERATSQSARMPFSTFLEQLVVRARVYRQLVSESTGVPKIDRRLRYLRLIRAQPSYAFLMALRASNCDDKTFEEVLRLTETFLFRRHTTRERTNENETVFAQLCSVDPGNPLPEVRARYSQYCPSDERFRQELVAATFPSRLLDRARYCLERIELHDTHQELLPAGSDLVHIEHIIPQKIKTKRAKKQFGDWVTYLGKDAVSQHPRYVSRIGNLTLFSGELNISASNNPYHSKKVAHAKSAFKLTKELPVKYREFRFKQVEQRSTALADLALKIWPAI